MSELQVPTRWREALTELEPAPHVLDDVLEAVREVPVQRPVRSLRRILPAALAAAALVVGGWLLMRAPTPGPGGEDVNLPLSFEAAVSIGELEAVREAIGPLDRWFDSLDEAEMPTADEPWSVLPFHITLPWPEGSLPLATWGRVKAAPSDKLAPSVVRYVVRHGVTPEVTRRWSGVGPLPLRNVVLGDELVDRWRKQLAELGAPVEGRELRLVLSTDEANPVETQVYVPLTAGHSGSLVIGNDLARALRLHQFEMPGGIELATPEGPVSCRRAWIRVRAPALGYDGGMEVAVLPARGAGLLGTGPGTHAGLLTTQGALAMSLSPRLPRPIVARSAQGVVGLLLSDVEPSLEPQRVLLDGDAAGRMSWSIPAGSRAFALRVGEASYLVSSDIADADPSTTDVRLDLMRSTVGLRFTDPRSLSFVAISRVWRGGRAIVGEAGSWLTVQFPGDGTLLLVHRADEDLRGLRAALVPVEASGHATSGRVAQWSHVETASSAGPGPR
ncbi:MAG: hypothetical protein AB7T63_02160 [Planctomycetota bacterium]